jgi:integrase
MDAKESAKALSERLKRRLTTGESVYFSAGKQYKSAETPNGRWVVKVRRTERGRLTKFPVRSFGKPEEAVAYAESTRPENRKASGVGQVQTRPGAKVGTVRDLYQYCRAHTWKSLSPKRRDLKESRWTNHLESYWGSWTLASVRRSAAQEWLTEKEDGLHEGKGLAQLNQSRIDMLGYFRVGIRMEFFEFSNPFEQLSFTPAPSRSRVTIESKRYADLFLTLSWLTERGLVLDWVSDMFQIGLLTGMREGEILALRGSCIDLDRKAILVNRALARKSRSLDERGIPYGEVRPQGIWFPKGGSSQNPKARYVPLPNQLLPTMDRLASTTDGLIFGTKDGKLKQLARFRTAWATMTRRLSEVSAHNRTTSNAVNEVINLVQRAKVQLPNCWEVITFRDSRNSFASYAAEVGVPEPTRMALMGHEGACVTFRS